jgi:hypothetical protein
LEASCLGWTTSETTFASANPPFTFVFMNCRYLGVTSTKTMSSSSRSSVPSPPPLKVRKRATTRVLLGSDYPENVVRPLDPPQPLTAIQDYDENRIKKGLIYAESVLRNPIRRLSPIGEQALKLYKEACAKLLDMEEDGLIYEEPADIVQDIKNEWLGTVRTFEQSAQYTKYLRLTDSNSAQELQDELVKLQKYGFYSRYGDILAEVCKELRHQAETRKVEGWQTLVMKYWTDIDQNLQTEKSAYQKMLKGANCHEDCPTHMAIFNACKGIGFEMNETLAVIHEYAERNTMFHSPIEPMIKQGRFHSLQKALYNDFCDIPKVIKSEEIFQTQLMSTIVRTMMQQWFDFEERDIDNYEAWTPSASLRAYREKLMADDPPQEIDIAKKVRRDILKAVKQRQEEARHRELMEEIDLNLVLGQNRGTKRVASSQLESGLKEAEAQRLKWKAVTNVAERFRTLSAAYVLTYGELTAAPDVVEDSLLE